MFPSYFLKVSLFVGHVFETHYFMNPNKYIMLRQSWPFQLMVQRLHTCDISQPTVADFDICVAVLLSEPQVQILAYVFSFEGIKR